MTRRFTIQMVLITSIPPKRLENDNIDEDIYYFRLLFVTIRTYILYELYKGLVMVFDLSPSPTPLA